MGKNWKSKDIIWEVDNNNCWICISHKSRKDGRVVVTRNNKQYYMHLYMYEQAYGKKPEHLLIRHKCDNHKCINPEHMELGTHHDNMKDMVERNRSLKGIKNHKAKLTEDDVKYIKSQLKYKTNIKLAKEFNVTHQLISKIRRNKSWQHI